MAQYKTVIFDIGNVLVRFAWDEYVDALWDRQVADRVTEAIFGNKRWDELDKGTLSPEEACQTFIQADPEMENEIRYTFDHCLDSLHRLDYPIPWLKELRERGLQTLFLSNYSKLLWEGKREVLDFLPYMDGGVFSFQYGVIKPGPEIYRILCRKYSLTPAECIFIDDREENVAAAAELGFQTILFTEYSQVKEQLDNYLV